MDGMDVGLWGELGIWETGETFALQINLNICWKVLPGFMSLYTGFLLSANPGVSMWTEEELWGRQQQELQKKMHLYMLEIEKIGNSRRRQQSIDHNSNALPRTPLNKSAKSSSR